MLPESLVAGVESAWGPLMESLGYDLATAASGCSRVPSENAGSARETTTSVMASQGQKEEI